MCILPSKQQKKKKREKRGISNEPTVPCSRNCARDKIIFIFHSSSSFGLLSLLCVFRFYRDVLSRIDYCQRKGRLKILFERNFSSPQDENGGERKETQSRIGCRFSKIKLVSNSCLNQQNSARKIYCFNIETLMNITLIITVSCISITVSRP